MFGEARIDPGTTLGCGSPGWPGRVVDVMVVETKIKGRFLALLFSVCVCLPGVSLADDNAGPRDVRSATLRARASLKSSGYESATLKPRSQMFEARIEPVEGVVSDTALIEAVKLQADGLELAVDELGTFSLVRVQEQSYKLTLNNAVFAEDPLLEPKKCGEEDCTIQSVVPVQRGLTVELGITVKPGLEAYLKQHERGIYVRAVKAN